MKVFYLAADTGACGHYRCELPAEGLRALGHDVTVATRTTTQALMSSDVVVGQRVASDSATASWQYLTRNRPASTSRLGARPELVYELDDDVWALQHEKSNPAAGTWTPLLRNVEANLAVSDAVTVSTAPLAEVVRQHTDAPVHVVPNAIPDAVVDETQELATAPHNREFSIPGTLGWGGSQTHDADWEEAARPVARWAKRNESPIVLFGGVPGPLGRAMFNAGTQHRVEPWIHGDWARYYRTLRYQVDVGLAPLAASEFNRSKSDLRLLEFAALGIPWVASDFGPYGLRAGAEGGFRTFTPYGWSSALDALQTQEEREFFVRQGLKWARTRTVSAVAPLWEKALS